MCRLAAAVERASSSHAQEILRERPEEEELREVAEIRVTVGMVESS